MASQAVARSAGGYARRMTTAEEDRSRMIISDTAGCRAVPWWTGVWGLDQGYAPQDLTFAASSAAIACAAHALEIDQRRGFLQGRDERVDEARRWFEWLAETADDADARLRRLALRMMCDADIDPLDILPSAKALHGACSTPPRRKRS
jgi:hypothetical protein